MRRAALILSMFMVVSTIFSSTYAQDQSASRNNSDPTADYPMNQAGVLIQGAQWMDVPNQFPARTRNAHSIAASLSYGIVSIKIVAEYAGEVAPTQVGVA